ncbi:hypothetical protein ACJX0J_012646, partial [Zea mays]
CKEHFLKIVRNIVGDKLLKQASSQYQMQQTVPSGSMTGDQQKGYLGAHTIHMRQVLTARG